MCNLTFQKIFLDKINEVECNFNTHVEDDFKFCARKIIMEYGFRDSTLYDGIDPEKFDFTKYDIVLKIYDCVVKQNKAVSLTELAIWFKKVYDKSLNELSHEN